MIVSGTPSTGPPGHSRSTPLVFFFGQIRGFEFVVVTLGRSGVCRADQAQITRSLTAPLCDFKQLGKRAAASSWLSACRLGRQSVGVSEPENVETGTTH